MGLVAETASETLQLKHHYQAPREQVYEAWTRPEALGQWFGPHSHTCTVEKLEVREGGEYQIRLTPVSEDHDCKGDPEADSVCAGKFVKLKAPETIVMTFSWIENGADIGETLLSIELLESNNGTELILTHEKLPNEELRQAHAGGWQGSLECLEEFLQK